MSPSAAAQPKRRNVAVQQLEDVVEEVPGAASPRTPTARDASYDEKRHERQLRIKADDVSCENDTVRRRTRALDASTTEAARGGLINNLVQPTEKRTQAQTQAQLVASTKNRVCRNLHCKPRKTTNTQCERTEIDYQSTINTFRCTDKRLFVTARSTLSEHVPHREQPRKKAVETASV